MGQPEMIIQGDAEAALVDILRTLTPELPTGGSHPPLNISTSMIGYEPGDRRIVITQQGGVEGFVKIARPRLDVEVFAERRSIAKDIIEICLGSIKRQMGAYSGFGLFISDVTIEMQPANIPDKMQETARYVAAVRLTVVPSGAANTIPFS